MENNNLPKVLIVSRGVWDDTKGTSSTLTNLFQNYGSDKLAHIYIETKLPNTKCCKLFFQISEFSLIVKLFKWKTKTGKVLDYNDNKINISINDKISQQEDKTMNFVRKNRSILFSFVREILWLFNGWKTKELKQFILDFNPDIIWIDGSPLILMNRLSKYVLKVSKKPSSIFLMDDVYTYKSCNKNLFNLLYKYLLRDQVNKLVEKSNKVFVASPKMKHEYDEIFNINSVFITKGIDYSNRYYKDYEINNPIKLVYLGQILYGRIYTLISIVESLKSINKENIKMQLDIYTNNFISDKIRSKLEVENVTFIKDPIPYNEVKNIINKADVLIFMESFQKKYKNIARLSFSTKITDYLSSGKCILAVGPSDIAPIEYLKINNAAVVVSNCNELTNKLELLLSDKNINFYSKNAYSLGEKNHNKMEIDKLLFNELLNII